MPTGKKATWFFFSENFEEEIATDEGNAHLAYQHYD